MAVLTTCVIVQFHRAPMFTLFRCKNYYVVILIRFGGNEFPGLRESFVVKVVSFWQRGCEVIEPRKISFDPSDMHAFCRHEYNNELEHSDCVWFNMFLSYQVHTRTQQICNVKETYMQYYAINVIQMLTEGRHGIENITNIVMFPISRGLKWYWGKVTNSETKSRNL